jgi:hypothetical protein
MVEVDADFDRLADLLAAGWAPVHPTDLDVGDLRGALHLAEALVLGGEEAKARRAIGWALRHVPHAGRAGVGDWLAAQVYLAGLEMQLGMSKSARRRVDRVEHLAQELGDGPRVVQCLHLRAITYRQESRFDRALQWDQAAHTFLTERWPDGVDGRDRVEMDLLRSMGSTLTQQVVGGGRRESGRHFTSRTSDARWKRATALYRRSIDMAAMLGDRHELAHCRMRLALHRLRQLHRRGADERDIDSVPIHDLTVPARVIWDRELNSASLLGFQGDSRHLAATALIRVRDEDRRREYDHQVRMIDDILRHARVNQALEPEAFAAAVDP